MITVLPRGGLAKDYSIPRILGYSIRNIISIDLTKKIRFFSFGKKSFLGSISIWLYLYIGGYGQMITVLHRGGGGGGCQNDYNITWGEGALRTP